MTPPPGGRPFWPPPPKQFISSFQIVRGRTAAAKFCDKAGIPEAARLYREEVAIAREAFGVFLPAWDGNDAPRVVWLADKTKREAVAIEQMLAKEQAAIAEIEKALAILPSREWKVELVEHEALAILGVRQRFSFTKGPHPKTLWESEFMKRQPQIKPLATEPTYYGLIIPTADADVADYVAGMRIGTVTNAPAGLEIVLIPAGQFAEVEFDFKDIGESGKYALETWLPASKCELNPAVPAREILCFGKGPTRLRIPICDRSPRDQEQQEKRDVR